MSVTQLLGILKDRGLSVVLKDGQPFIHGKREALTDALRESLKFHRSQIIEHLQTEESKTVDVEF